MLRSRGWLVLSVLLSGVVSVSGQEKNDPPTKTQIQDVVIPGQLLAGDPRDPVRMQPSKVHALKLLKGKIYQIDLVSTDFDSYLRLEDAAGSKLAEDDDGGLGLNARLRFVAPAEDIYKVVVTTFAGGVGTYTLTVKEATAVPAKAAKVDGAPLPLAPATRLDPPVPAKAIQIDGQLGANDPIDPVRRKPSKVYAVELSPDLGYQIDLASGDFDAYLRLTDAQGKELDRDDDGGGNLNAKLLFHPPAKAEYKIVATSLNGNEGNFRFTITARRAEKPDATKVRELGKDSLLILGKLTATDARDTVRMNCHAHVHQVKLTAGKTYVIDLMSGSMDSYLRLENGQGTQLAEDDDGGDAVNSRLRFQAPETGTFRIIATTLNPSTGSYALSIRED